MGSIFGSMKKLFYSKYTLKPALIAGYHIFVIKKLLTYAFTVY